jgi:hypothetical protein
MHDITSDKVSNWKSLSSLKQTCPELVDFGNEERIACSGMLRHVTLVRSDVSGELSASFVRVTKIRELRTTLAVTSN